MAHSASFVLNWLKLSNPHFCFRKSPKLLQIDNECAVHHRAPVSAVLTIINLSPKLLKILETVTGPSTTATVLLQSLMFLLQSIKIFLVSGSEMSQVADLDISSHFYLNILSSLGDATVVGLVGGYDGHFSFHIVARQLVCLTGICVFEVLEKCKRSMSMLLLLPPL